ncbi:hypothetical protein M514_10378 [Trichuris suis]|uniref:Uncharacterized protein n=1 Tax=Trichuris suis TaxID=68888 RepID=A0A085NEK8_9BILA|nr:hypothetical protein M513_10378 [Trichuris suis]KFD67904.1 hypothetical protein M514_10378 [Trichuris suis]
MEDDSDQRVELCETFLENVEKKAVDIDKIMWTDEAIFKLNGHVSRYNVIYWSDANPQQTLEREDIYAIYGMHVVYIAYRRVFVSYTVSSTYS